MAAGLVSDDVGAEREFLERSLADLDREHAAGDLTDADYHDLRARYEARLARSGRENPRDEAVFPPRTKGRVARTVATVAIVAAVGVGAGVAVASFAGEREPGEQVSGDLPATSDDRLRRAAERFQDGDARGAIELYQEVLDENPEDVQALTYLGWTLRNIAGDDDRLLDAGIGFIEQALEVDPTFAEAWFFRGIIYLRDEDDADKAVDALRLALGNDPSADLEGAARELLAEIAQTSTTTTP